MIGIFFWRSQFEDFNFYLLMKEIPAAVAYLGIPGKGAKFDKNGRKKFTI